MDRSGRRRLMVALSAPSMFGFMRGQPTRMRQMGYDVTITSAFDDRLERQCAAEGSDRAVVDMARNISLVKDALAFVRLVQLMMRLRPAAVILSGPKAVFLGSLASFVANIPIRISVYHGMRQENLKGPLRWILDLCDAAAFSASTTVLAVSASLAAAVRSRGIDPLGKVRPIVPGTAGGLSDSLMRMEASVVVERRLSMRETLSIMPHARVILFLGRLTEDKGLLDLQLVMESLDVSHPDALLLVAGPEEPVSAAGCAAIRRLRVMGNVKLLGNVTDVSGVISAADFLMLPTRREGFGMAVIESGILGRPTVSYDVTGIRDAVINGRTGTLVPLGDLARLTQAVRAYLEDDALREQHGVQAREHAALYNSDAVWANYESLLREDP